MIQRWIGNPGINSASNNDPGSWFNELWPRVLIQCCIVTPGHYSTLNCDPGLWFHVKLWPQVIIPRWIVTPSHDSTINSDPGSGSQFKVEFWPDVIIQCGILTRGSYSTWNSDPSTRGMRLKKVSTFNRVLKIQLLRRVIIQRKSYWILTPGIQWWGGQNFILHRRCCIPHFLWDRVLNRSELSFFGYRSNQYYCGHQRQRSPNWLYFKRQKGNGQALRSQGFWPWCYTVKRFYWSNVNSKYDVLVSHG